MYRGSIRVFPHNSRSQIVFTDMQVSTFIGPGFIIARQDFKAAIDILASTAFGLHPQPWQMNVSHSFFKIDGRRTSLDAIVGISIPSVQLSDEDKIVAQDAIASGLRRLFGLDFFIRIEDNREDGFLSHARHSMTVAIDDALAAIIELQLKRGRTLAYDAAPDHIKQQVLNQLAQSSDPKALRAFDQLQEGSMA